MNTTTKGKVKVGGRFQVECYRWHDTDGERFRNAKGQFERRLIWQEDVHNLVTTQGLNHINDVTLHGATQITAWYCTLVETDTNPAAGMTYAVPVYTESSSYDEATRPAYNGAEASSGVTTNSANKAVFTISATKTMYGASLVGGGTGATTKADTAGGGTLLCYAKFTSARAVYDDDVINLTYAFTSADDGV